MKKSCAIPVAVAMTAVTMLAGDIVSLRQAPRHENSAEEIVLPPQNTLLCGALVYSDLWGEMQGDQYVNPITAGIYTIEAREGGATKLVKQVQSMARIRSAVLANGVFYTYQQLTGENAYDDVAFVSYSGSTWSQSSSKEVTNANLASCMTYDPVTKKVYGFCYDSEEQYFCKFSTINTSTGTASEIVFPRMDKRDGHALAATPDGRIYAIWSALGKLIKIDPVGKTYEDIGRTGIYPGDPVRGYVNSMTYDEESGMLYWASTDDKGKGALYKINPANAETTLVIDFANNESFAGLYTLPLTLADDAPEGVSDISVEYTSPGALTANISFTLPVASIGDDLLQGPLAVEIVTGAETVVAGNLSPGAKYRSDVITLPEGESQIAVTVCTATTRGEKVTHKVMTGIDLPGAPENLKVSLADNVPTLTWDAPSAGQNGGWFDASTLQYRVTRMPDATVVAEGLKDTRYADTGISRTMAVWYEVCAYNQKGTGPTATSDKIVVGDGYKLPFVEKFDTKDDFDLWTIVDLNGTTTWEYSTSGKYVYSKYATPDVATDDWLISPKVYMEEGKVYALSYDSKVYNKNYPENFSFWLGTSVDPASMTTQICSKEDYRVTSWESNRVVFRAPGTGYYYLGLYTNSIPHHWELDIDNIGISEVDSRVPGLVNGLEAKAGEQGAMNATLKFRMPEKDAKGNAITEEMSAVIYGKGTATENYKKGNLHAGDEVEWTDNAISDSGIVTYRVAASTDAGEGEATEVSVFVGKDVPGSVSGIRVEEKADGVTLSWSAPETGANGGWFDPAEVSYRIVRSLDAKVLADGLKDTYFTDKTLKLNKQELLYYLITPYADGKKGTYATTAMSRLYGPAFQTPFVETFPGADMKNYPWISESDGSQYVWSLDATGVNPPASDRSGDNGLATFISTASTAGITGMFYSPKISPAGLNNPELSFWMYHSNVNSDRNETLEVLISTDGENYEPMGAGILRDNGTTGWRRHSMLLDADMASAPEVRFMFRVKALGGANIYLDDIRLDNRSEGGLEVSGLSAAGKAAVGATVVYTAKVANLGADKISEVNVALKIDDVVVASNGVRDLEGGDVREVSLTLRPEEKGTHEVTFVASCGNVKAAESRGLTVVDPVLPKVDEIDVQAYNGEVNLSWESPMRRGAVCDDFESYTDWAIDGVGEWTMADRDYDVTYRINKDLDEYPHECDAKAFQVCNAKTIGIDIWDQGKAHSGDKMMMAMSSMNRPNSDFLISPLLNGGKQTVTFYARSFTHDGVNPERFRVYAGSKNPMPEDMTQISAGDYIESTEQWTEYSYQLEEGTRYFAIECVSDDSFAFFVDDVTFNDLTVPATEVTGYEVFRNGVSLGNVSSTNYVDKDERAPLEREYMIRTHYGNGEYRDSDVLKIQYSDVDSLATDNAAIYDVYDVAGICVMHGASLGDVKNLDRGIYILRAGAEAIVISF